MKKLWNKFTAWVSGWPESTIQGQKIKKDNELFAEEKEKQKIIKKSVEESQSRKAKTKKPKGLNPKKKKKSKGRKQGNMS